MIDSRLVRGNSVEVKHRMIAVQVPRSNDHAARVTTKDAGEAKALRIRAVVWAWFLAHAGERDGKRQGAKRRQRVRVNNPHHVGIRADSGKLPCAAGGNVNVGEPPAAWIGRKREWNMAGCRAIAVQAHHRIDGVSPVVPHEPSSHQGCPFGSREDGAHTAIDPLRCTQHSGGVENGDLSLKRIYDDHLVVEPRRIDH